MFCLFLKWIIKKGRSLLLLSLLNLVKDMWRKLLFMKHLSKQNIITLKQKTLRQVFFSYRKNRDCWQFAILHKNQCLQKLTVRESVQTRSFFWSVSSCIRTRKNSVFGHFSRSVMFSGYHMFAIEPMHIFCASTFSPNVVNWQICKCYSSLKIFQKFRSSRHRYSIKKLLLNILQYSRENTPLKCLQLF